MRECDLHVLYIQIFLYSCVCNIYIYNILGYDNLTLILNSSRPRSTSEANSAEGPNLRQFHFLVACWLKDISVPVPFHGIGWVLMGFHGYSVATISNILKTFAGILASGKQT